MNYRKSVFSLLFIYVLLLSSIYGEEYPTDSFQELNEFKYTLNSQGWVDLYQFLELSNGSYSLGQWGGETGLFNDMRDPGSKLLYFNSENGNNTLGEVYWWNGSHIVDSNGSFTNPNNGELYGTDPLQPNENAIVEFRDLSDAENDIRLRTQEGNYDPSYFGLNYSQKREWRISFLSGGYQDWFLFKRGQVHNKLTRMAGGKSEEEPMVITAYGNKSDGRAIFNASISGHNWGGERNWIHIVLTSIEFHNAQSWLWQHTAKSHSPKGGPVTMYMEDVYFAPESGIRNNHINYPPTKTKFRRSIFAHSWNPGAHVQGYFTSGFRNRVTFEEVFMYRNGYKQDSLHHIAPRRDIYSRNIYAGGGAQMGHTYRNMISMDGGSGGPQMRYGGLMEHSLVMEGYFYSSTRSTAVVNDWLLENPKQVGRSAIVRDSLQFITPYPTLQRPDLPSVSDGRSQPRWGYTLQGASFGSIAENNIISGEVYDTDLGNRTTSEFADYGINIGFNYDDYDENDYFSQRDNIIRNNVFYKVRDSIRISGNARDVANISIYNNTGYSQRPLSIGVSNLNNIDQIYVSNNEFYTQDSLTNLSWINQHTNKVSSQSSHVQEGWPDPNRTLKRYVREELGITLLDWDDARAMGFNQSQIDEYESQGLEFDPAGMRTFALVAKQMRMGGTESTPSSGKPAYNADYEWDERYTALSVINWVREGFNMAPVETDKEVPPICGDNICQSSENTLSCRSDCPDTKSPDILTQLGIEVNFSTINTTLNISLHGTSDDNFIVSHLEYNCTLGCNISGEINNAYNWTLPLISFTNTSKNSMVEIIVYDLANNKNITKVRIGNSSFISSYQEPVSPNLPKEPKENDGGGGGSGGSSSSRSSSDGDENLNRVQEYLDSQSCIPNLLKSNWSICRDGTQERTIRDLNSCEETKRETRLCSGDNEKENIKLNAREVNLSKNSDFSYSFSSQVELSKPNGSTNSEDEFISSIKVKERLSSRKTVIIEDSSTNSLYLARLIDEEPINSSYFYELEKVSESIIPLLELEGFVKESQTSTRSPNSSVEEDNSSLLTVFQNRDNLVRLSIVVGSLLLLASLLYIRFKIKAAHSRGFSSKGAVENHFQNRD